MTERLNEPELAWYRLQTREIAVLLVLGLLVAVLAGWALLHDNSIRDLKLDSHELPPARVNVNTASEAELTALPGIGERKAKRIADARKQARIEDLSQLAKAAGGIPQKDIERMKKYVVFD